MLLEYSQTLILSSDSVTGATNVSRDGDRFDVYLNDPITIPKNAVNCTVECVKAQVWYVSPNISAEIGNNIIDFIHDGNSYGSHNAFSTDKL